MSRKDRRAYEFSSAVKENAHRRSKAHTKEVDHIIPIFLAKELGLSPAVISAGINARAKTRGHHQKKTERQQKGKFTREEKRLLKKLKKLQPRLPGL